MNYKEYINLSLELLLFFDRIMKEHSFFLEMGFTEKNNGDKKIANNFQRAFSDILNKIIYLADGKVSNNLLTSGEIVTSNTLEAEKRVVI